MLTYELLKNHAGILLCGDYHTLETMHGVIHEVNEHSPLIVDKEGVFLGLAYDVRKAYERQRRIINPPKHFKEQGMRYGVEILWPVLLVQARMLRASLAYFDSTKLQQSITYALESVIEQALDDDFGAAARSIRERWLRIDPAVQHLDDKLDSRGIQFSLWTKTQRKARFAGLMLSFDPLYEMFYGHRVKDGEPGLVSPAEYEALAGMEWPDPRW